MLLNSQRSMAFTMYIFRRLHEYSGPTATSAQALDALLPQNLKMEDLSGQG